MRWVARVFVALVAIVLIAVAAVDVVSNGKLNKTYDIPPQALALAVPSDAASVARGRHLAVAIGKCVVCHGADLGGTVFLDVPPFRVIAPNLTRGDGGAGRTFSDADFVRAIRHGVDPSGRPLLIMPSDDYAHFTNADLADIIAYVKSVAPVDRQLPNTVVRPLGRFLLAIGKLPDPPAASIDHGAPPPADMLPSVSVAYGRYIAQTGGCIGCHGAGLSGGPIPGLPPNAPPAQNITPAGIGAWSDADFIRALRVGKRPDGSTMNRLMPWAETSLMTDDELKALLLYLRSVPPRPTGTR